MVKFAGLRAKMYTCKVNDGKTVKKAKGVKKNIVKNEITFDDYVDCLRSKKDKIYTQNSIISNKHIIYSTSNKKIGLSGNDTKRFILEDNINTIPWGHYNLNMNI